MNIKPNASAQRAADHGYTTSRDALYAIWTIYAATSALALESYYAACYALRGTDAIVDQPTLTASALWDDAARRLRTIWAQSRDDAHVTRLLAEMSGATAGADWIAEVALDVRLRLAGDMGRDLPVPCVSPMASEVEA